jgi:hypothetical protein
MSRLQRRWQHEGSEGDVESAFELPKHCAKNMNLLVAFDEKILFFTNSLHDLLQDPCCSKVESN